ncbi:MAG: hypothetical protein ACYTDX_06765 [Planctomycetota bacterium]
MSGEFGRRLKNIMDGVRAELEQHSVDRHLDAAAAAARRRHLEKVTIAECRKMLREAEPVFASLGLKTRDTPEEIRVEALPGARLPEKYPPWMRISCRPPAFDEVRVAVLEVTWRVDDPRTPLPEAPNTIRMVMDDDSDAAQADLEDFLAVTLEDFVTNVTKHDTLPHG